MADLLKLSPRVKSVAKAGVESSLNLPANVSIYIPPKNDDRAVIEEAWGNADGPVVDFKKGKLASCKNSGNQWYGANYHIPSAWTSYQMYALERYCYFKEQSEGSVGSALKAWYDDGIEYIIKYQRDDGAISSQSLERNMPLQANTALFLLFMVRASEIISLPPVATEMLGGEGFDRGKLIQGDNGTIASSEAEKSLKQLIDNLSDDSLDERQLQQMTEAMKRAVREFKESGEKSRGEVTAFLKTMIGEKNYYRRLIAIRFLSGEQDMNLSLIHI